jgi:hypothetical protein
MILREWYILPFKTGYLTPLALHNHTNISCAILVGGFNDVALS